MATTEQILDSMDAISLADMDAHALMNRIDTKYILGRDSLPELFQSVRDDYRVLSIQSRRLFAYRTLYFDTPSHECYLHHHNGYFTRRKYRIRQYRATGACYLEVKTKNNKRRTNKKRIPIDGFENPLSPESLSFFESITGKRVELLPQLWTDFSRATLVNRHLPERVTIDFDLNFTFEDSHIELPSLVIAEVKQERDNRHTIIREQLRHQHIRPMRISKYCIGTALLKPELKSNRFKPKLLAIRKIA